MSKNCQLLDIWEISVVKTHIVILSSVIFTFVCFNLILIWLLFCQDGNTGNCWSRGECWQGYLYLTHLIHLACPILQLSFLSCFIIFSILGPEPAFGRLGLGGIVGRVQFSWVHFSCLASRLQRSARRRQIVLQKTYKRWWRPTPGLATPFLR